MRRWLTPPTIWFDHMYDTICRQRWWPHARQKKTEKRMTKRLTNCHCHFHSTLYHHRTPKTLATYWALIFVEICCGHWMTTMRADFSVHTFQCNSVFGLNEFSVRVPSHLHNNWMRQRLHGNRKRTFITEFRITENELVCISGRNLHTHTHTDTSDADTIDRQ